LNWVFVYHEANQGKAAAIHTALQRATSELTVIHDADLEYHPLDLSTWSGYSWKNKPTPFLVRGFLPASTGAYFSSGINWAIIS